MLGRKPISHNSTVAFLPQHHRPSATKRGSAGKEARTAPAEAESDAQQEHHWAQAGLPSGKYSCSFGGVFTASRASRVTIIPLSSNCT